MIPARSTLPRLPHPPSLTLVPFCGSTMNPTMISAAGPRFFGVGFSNFQSPRSWAGVRRTDSPRAQRAGAVECAGRRGRGHGVLEARAWLDNPR